MGRRLWFRPLLAGVTLWACLQGCGSDSSGPGPTGTDGGGGPDGQAGEGASSATAPTAGKEGRGAEAGMATAGMSAAGEGQAGGAPLTQEGKRVWLSPAVGEGQGTSHRVRIRLGGPQSGRGDGITVSVKVGMH